MLLVAGAVKQGILFIRLAGPEEAGKVVAEDFADICWVKKTGLFQNSSPVLFSYLPAF